MRRFLLVIALLVATNLYGQVFTPSKYDFVNYQQMESNIDGEAKPALIVFLHGGHSRGDDNKSQLNVPAVRTIAQYITDNHMSAYFVVPQCPSDYEWIAGRDGISGCDDKIVGIIRYYLSHKKVDANKVYICGTSMGSWAIWQLVARNPKLFAAAFIASGAPRGVSPSDFTTTPLYVTVGSEERTYYRIQELVSNIKTNGGVVEFDVLEGLEHPQACRSAFTLKRLDWLLSHTRSTK